MASNKPFDIVNAYRNLLSSDPDVTMPVAAIESLVLSLQNTPTSTVSETLALLTSQINILKSSIPNPISLSAGTDLFQRYIITQLQRPGSTAASFEILRHHLISNGKLFVQRAKDSRNKIAAFGKNFIRDGCTVLTSGGSRVVGSVLQSAAASNGSAGQGLRFRVIYVCDEEEGKHKEGGDTVSALRKVGVPVATIPPAAVAYTLSKVDMVLVGAEGVVENGGVVSRLGTYQLGLLAKGMGKPFYVVAESHKFVRLYPLGQWDLGIKQKVLLFKSGAEGKEKVVDDELEDEGVEMSAEEAKTGAMTANGCEDAVDFTPPNLISGIITEGGVLTPSAVSEELIKIWL